MRLSISTITDFSITAPFIPMTSKCFILHNSVFVVYNHLAFFITTCYCFIICLRVFYLVSGFNNHLFKSLSLCPVILLVKPTGAFTSQDSCNCNSSVGGHLSRDAFLPGPEQWSSSCKMNSGLFFWLSFTLTLSSCRQFQLLLTQSVLAGVPGKCLFSAGSISCFPSHYELNLGKHTYPFYSGCQLASVRGVKTWWVNPDQSGWGPENKYKYTFFLTSNKSWGLS